MFSFLLKRFALVIPTFLGITLLVFSLIRLLPGDPVEALSGERGMTDEGGGGGADRVADVLAADTQRRRRKRDSGRLQRAHDAGVAGGGGNGAARQYLNFGSLHIGEWRQHKCQT